MEHVLIHAPCRARRPRRAARRTMRRLPATHSLCGVRGSPPADAGRCAALSALLRRGGSLCPPARRSPLRLCRERCPQRSVHSSFVSACPTASNVGLLRRPCFFPRGKKQGKEARQRGTASEEALSAPFPPAWEAKTPLSAAPSSFSNKTRFAGLLFEKESKPSPSGLPLLNRKAGTFDMRHVKKWAPARLPLPLCRRVRKGFFLPVILRSKATKDLKPRFAPT